MRVDNLRRLVFDLKSMYGSSECTLDSIIRDEEWEQSEIECCASCRFAYIKSADDTGCVAHRYRGNSCR